MSDMTKHTIMDADAVIVSVLGKHFESDYLRTQLQFANKHEKYIILVYQGKLHHSDIWEVSSVIVRYSDDIKWKNLIEAKSAQKVAVIEMG